MDIIKKSVAKDTSDSELKYFLNVCKSTGLNPFKKEIWCYKDFKGNLLVFVGRDGFLSNAQNQSDFAGIRSCDVCENDDLVLDMMNPSQNKHLINFKNRGKIIGAYAIVFRKSGEPTISYVEFKSYDKGQSAWKTHPAAMIKKVAETNALKLAFSISGVQSEHEYDLIDDKVIPIDHSIINEDLIQIKEGLELINDEIGLNKCKTDLN
ncbi:MAG: recombinase RecT [Saprospiraceae bacterium]|nr:recombinase RecT [Saprospiraceae bacterium]